MALTDEQAASIKEQLLKQIRNLPENQREKIKEYIASMNGSQLEEFLKKNTSQAEQAGNQKGKKASSCVFCNLAKKEIESFVIYEDKDYLAALEIKPFSLGHSIVIPKKHIKEAKSLPSRAFSVAKKVGRHIIKKLGAESLNITTSEEMNHAIINVIPIYKGEPLDYKRKEMTQQKLKELAIKIGELKKSEKKIKSKKAVGKLQKVEETIKNAIIKMNRRIP